MSESILIKGGTLVTMDANNSIVRGDLLIRDGRISEVGSIGSTADTLIDAGECALLPGFVQTHLHLCQTIFRGSADDLSLIDWLKQRVWPLEAAHTAESIRASARLGLAELIKGGTTCALTMETVRHTDQIFKAVSEFGFRATVGKCMMDKGDGVPAELQETAAESIAESVSLLKRWNGAAQGRIRYCFAPRFALSCTSELLAEVARVAREYSVMVHTHASENRTECELVERETGLTNIAYLASVGLTASNVALAHCVHVSQPEIATLRRSETKVLHCPSSNLKLGSGIAPVTEMLAQGISVSLGADGAACNNRLDMFTEMRTAALLQKVSHGPEALPARRVMRMATIDGARALGLQDEIGSLETGKRADVTIVNLKGLHTAPRAQDIISALVYAAQPSDVETVLVDGVVLLKEGQLVCASEEAIIADANRESTLLRERAGLKKFRI